MHTDPFTKNSENAYGKLLHKFMELSEKRTAFSTKLWKTLCSQPQMGPSQGAHGCEGQMSLTTDKMSLVEGEAQMGLTTKWLSVFAKQPK